MNRSTLFLFTVTCLLTDLMAEEIDFAHEIVPILRKHCAECHTGKKSEGGFSFSTRRQIAQSGYVKEGEAESSRLIELLESTDENDQMPPSERPRVSKAEIQVLKDWVNAGLQWEPGFRFGPAEYEPPLLPRPVDLPAAESEGQNPIDRIVNHYFDRRGIQRPSLISDQLFLRRVHMDLIGLLPTLEEQRRFQSLPEKSRRNLAIENLLSRNRDYAEHWITFWNDLLRNDYAGTGYIDGGRRQITNWLYESLVSNKAYNTFVKELIAPTDASSGFIDGIKWRGNVNASQVREIQFSQNVSQVFLGINMKCASCHDSFIDRWTLDEAYGLAAIYSTRELEIHRCDKPVGRTASPAWIFPEIGNVDMEADQPERLLQLASLMTSKKNGRFARTIVNRIWHRLMGRGIVHPVDAMHTEPWNADVLDFLANHLVEQKYDLKKLLYLIATSHTYQSVSVAAVDSASSGEHIFRGPQPRHLTAEQFMDAVWQLTGQFPKTIQAPIESHVYHGEDLPTADLSGKWVWSYPDSAGSPAGETAAFRKSFSLSSLPSAATLVITCDNEYEVWLNGKHVGGDTNWNSIESLNLVPQLQSGLNELLIVGRNAGNAPNPAGLYAEIVLHSDDNPTTVFATDESWQASRQVPENQDLSTVAWHAAAVLTRQGFLGEATDQAIRNNIARAHTGRSRYARAALMKSDMLMRSLGRPNREQIVTTRPESLSTLQAIDLANGEILDSVLAGGGRQLFDSHQLLQNRQLFLSNLFQTALTREPTAQEFSLMDETLGTSPTAESIQDVLWLLVMHPEFQFIM